MMAHPQLIVLGYSEAAMFLRMTPLPKVDALISIHGAREFGIEVNVSHRLDLTFDDAEVPVVGDVVSMLRVSSRKRWAEQNGLVEVLPTAEDAMAIIRFAELIGAASKVVLCHCGAGMSRAPAAALICLAVWGGTGTEADCLAEVRKLRRGAVPHVGLVRFADQILGREGKLFDVVRLQK
jgi:predicted protein tyrosine phosphatase